jgi:isopenicillin N synthase-like dioxygenase
MKSLPVIDLACALQGDSGARLDAARLLDASCRSHGFFYITGHGVPADLRKALFERSRAFFDLPLETKSKWHIDRSTVLRGYDPIGRQSLQAGMPADIKESFYLGVDRGPEDALVLAGVPNQGPNQWPDDVVAPGFRATAEAYASALSLLGHQVLSLLAQSLALAPDYFSRYLTDPMPVLRLLHYPPVNQPLLPGQEGCGAHTDWGSITLLAQDPTGGLQLQLDGQWQDAPFVPDSFVVNLGDLMARWSNDRWRSTLHRVLPQHPGSHRYSAAYFFDIDYNAEVSVLPGCFDSLNPARYTPITAGAHIVEMYRRTTVTAPPVAHIQSHPV